MNFQRPATDALRYLFSKYLKGPTGIYTISDVAKRHRVNAVELSDYLLVKGWVRERWVYSENQVGCKITIRGIEEIDPAYVREKLRQMIGGLGESGGSKELVEILEHKVEEYSIALDMVRQLEAMGLILIRHPKDSIVIELTDEGRRYYQQGSRTFFTLMSY